MNLNCFIPERNPSSASIIGTPCANGRMTSGTNSEIPIATMPPASVHSAAVRVNRRQKTLKRSVTTSGGVTAAVNAPCAS
jgi:hypothetical protein